MNLIPEALTNPAFYAGINTWLGARALGLGATLALFALMQLLFSGKTSVAFLKFAVAIMAIGAVLQGFELYENNECQLKQALPDLFWGDFMDARGRSEFPPPAQQLKRSDYPFVDGIEIAKDTPITKKIILPASGCARFLAAVGPPAKIDVQTDPEEFSTMGPSRDYYKTVVLCVPKGKSDRTVKVTVKANEQSNKFSLAFYNCLPGQETCSVTSPQPSRPSAPTPPPASPPPEPNVKPTQFTKIVCIGEFEGNCPGQHDKWVGCKPEEVFAAEVCGAAKPSWRRLATVSGDHCGYGLTQITCD